VVAPEQPVPRFGVADVVTHADDRFDSRAGLPNPFLVDFTATVTSPSGRKRQIRGFFDGDGKGGPVGTVFRLRVQPDEEGTWAWVTRSELPELDGLAGEFECAGALQGLFGGGGIVVSEHRPRFFAQEDGTPIFLVGKFLDADAPEAIRYSHTFLSDDMSDQDRQRMLERHLGMGLNKLNIYLANRGDYGGLRPTTPWSGSALSFDESRFALDRWHTFEAWIEKLRETDVVAQLWLFADDSGFGRLSRFEKEQLVSYTMARLSPHVNTMFVLMLEWQEDWSREKVEALGRFTQSQNPWGRLISAHGRAGDFELGSSAWVDFADLQAGFVPAGRIYQTGSRNRSAVDMPVLQEEFTRGEESDENRHKTWAAWMSGAAGLGTGAFLLPLEQFIAAVEFSSLAPAQDLLVGGEAYVIAWPDSQYVAYLPGGGRIALDLTGAGGPFTARWFDPRDGSWTDLGAAVPGGQVSAFRAPDGRDWALLLSRAEADSLGR
jgi:hypothetical protein